MKLSWLLVLLAACHGGGGTAQSDAAPPDSIVCPSAPTDIPRCTTTCGNSAIDECFDAYKPGEALCTVYTRYTEACDGTQLAFTCAQYGYYGGTAACAQQCRFDDSGCDACATDSRILACSRLTSQLYKLAATDPSSSGAPRLAVLAGGVAILTLGGQGFQQVATGPSPSGNVQLIGIRNGWLVTSNTSSALTIDHVALDGTIASTATISQDVIALALTYGPSDRALVAWLRYGNPSAEIWYAILDASSNFVSAPRVLTAGNLNGVTAGSDGSSFFVASPLGELYQIGADGTLLSMATGFPETATQFGHLTPRLAASATSRWYIVKQLTTDYTVQRFDAAGAAVGSAFTITPPADGLFNDWLSDGTDLLATLARPAPTSLPFPLPPSPAVVRSQQLVRIDTAGTIGQPLEVGRGASLPQLTRFGSDIALGWPGPGFGTQLAVVTP